MNEINTLIDVLNENSMQFTEREIRELLDAELEKDQDEMDTDLVILCLDVLEGKYSNADHVAKEREDYTANCGKRKLKITKVLTVAAIFAVILVIAIPAGAKFVHMDSINDLVKYDIDHFSINFNSDKDIQDVVDSLTLPSALIRDDCELSELQNISNGTGLSFEYDNGIYGNVIIHHNSDNDFYSGQGEANNEYYSAEEININGIKVLVIKADDLNTIMYLVNDDEYTITIRNCDFDTAKKIANTIGENE